MQKIVSDLLELVLPENATEFVRQLPPHLVVAIADQADLCPEDQVALAQVFSTSVTERG